MDPKPAPKPDDDGPTAPASARAERRLVMLDRLAEMSLDVAAELHGEILTAKAQEMEAGEQARPAPLRRRNIADLTLAFHRAARALRLTLALQEDLETRAAGAGAGRDDERPTLTRVKVAFVDSVAGIQSEPYEYGDTRPDFAAIDARRLQVGRTVRAIAKDTLLPGELSPRDAAEYVERFGREAEGKLETEREFENLMARPLSEIIDSICRDLGFTPDWAVIADEPWAQFEMAKGPVGAPLAPHRPPPRDKGPTPMRPPGSWPGRAGPS